MKVISAWWEHGIEVEYTLKNYVGLCFIHGGIVLEVSPILQSRQSRSVMYQLT